MRRLALGAMLLLVLGGAGTVRVAQADDSTTSVRVTHYYWTGNPMYSGVYPYHGAAACSWNLPLGTMLQFWDGRVVTCMDRGMLGWSGWVDIYAASYAEGRRIQAAYEYYNGRESVEILRWGWGGMNIMGFFCLLVGHKWGANDTCTRCGEDRSGQW